MTSHISAPTHSTFTFSIPIPIPTTENNLVSLHSLTVTIQQTPVETNNKVTHSVGQVLIPGYPTPPPSPELDDTLNTLPEPSPPRQRFTTVQLDDLDHLDDAEDDVNDDSYEFEEGCSIDYEVPTRPFPRLVLPSTGLRIPIPVILDTPHDLPQPATFRLRSPASLLALTGGKRDFTLDSEQTIWDRMPYSAAAAAIHARQPTEEDAVERLVSDTPEKRPNGLQWSMRQK